MKAVSTDSRTKERLRSQGVDRARSASAPRTAVFTGTVSVQVNVDRSPHQERAERHGDVSALPSFFCLAGGDDMDGRLLTIKEASEKYGVSDFTLRKRIKAGHLSVYVAPLDTRGRLLDPAELDAYTTPRLLVASRDREGAPA